MVQHNAAKKRSAEEVGPAKGVTCSGEERGTKRRSEDGEGAAAVAKRQRLDQLIKAGVLQYCMPRDCEPVSIILSLQGHCEDVRESVRVYPTR